MACTGVEDDLGCLGEVALDEAAAAACLGAASRNSCPASCGALLSQVSSVPRLPLPLSACAGVLMVLMRKRRPPNFYHFGLMILVLGWEPQFGSLLRWNGVG